MNEKKYKDCVGTTTNGERVVNYTDSQTLSKKDKEMLIANSMKAVRDGESKKAFLKNTKFIIDGMVSNNYDLEEENFELKQQLQSYKQKEDKLRERCKLGISELNYEISDWLDDSKTENNDVIEDLEIQKQIFKDILEILNEGDK